MPAKIAPAAITAPCGTDFQGGATARPHSRRSKDPMSILLPDRSAKDQPRWTNYLVVPYTFSWGGRSDDAGQAPARQPGQRESCHQRPESLPRRAAHSMGARLLGDPLRRPAVDVDVRARHGPADRLP